MRPLLMVLLLAGAAALAGCAGPGEPAPGTSDGDGTNVTAPDDDAGAPAAAAPGGECVSTLDESRSSKTPVWVLETTMGTMRLTLFCDKAPVTTQNFVNLTEQGFFDGTKFHRVIQDFMNQGGDPLSKDDSQQHLWGTGGSEPEIIDEFYCADGTIDHKMDNPTYPNQAPRPGERHQACGGELGLRHDTAGTLSMANRGPNTGSSQFFITAVPVPHLDGAHPVFGHTADQESLDVALAINRVDTDRDDRPVEPIVVQRAHIEWE